MSPYGVEVGCIDKEHFNEAAQWVLEARLDYVCTGKRGRETARAPGPLPALEADNALLRLLGLR